MDTPSKATPELSPHKTLVAFPSTDPDAATANDDIEITINQEQVAPPCVDRANRSSNASVEIIEVKSGRQLQIERHLH